MKIAVPLLRRFKLLVGLLPFVNVVEVGFVEGMGYMWIVQQKKVEHEFRMISKLMRHDVDISSNIKKGNIQKLKGVRAEELTLWPPVSKTTADPASGKVHFKSLAGMTKCFLTEAFAPGQ